MTHLQILSKVMKLAHQLNDWFFNFSKALRCAWALVKMGLGKIVDFAFEKENGEIRTAQANAILGFDVEKGFCSFQEVLSNGETQVRRFRFERFI